MKHWLFLLEFLNDNCKGHRWIPNELWMIDGDNC